MGFHRENFRGLLTRIAYCHPIHQTIVEKTFADRNKTAKFVKVLSLDSFHGILLIFTTCTNMHIHLDGSKWVLSNCNLHILYLRPLINVLIKGAPHIFKRKFHRINL